MMVWAALGGVLANVLPIDCVAYQNNCKTCTKETASQQYWFCAYPGGNYDTCVQDAQTKVCNRREGQSVTIVAPVEPVNYLQSMEDAVAYYAS